MLAPKRVKHRKAMKQVRHLRGTETRGNYVAFGDYGLMALAPAWVSNRQIEAARVALSRHLKRGGKVWIRIFPDKPLTTKPAETRMGKGKGAPDQWVAEVRAGKVMYEIKGVTEDIAKQALRLAGSKLPMRTKVVVRQQSTIL